jgi:ABC-type cobalamin/Fe3+-siderophores transport system ATPase subunit
VTRERGIATVVVLHDINAAMRACDRSMLLHEGRIVHFGSPAEVVTPASLAKVFGVAGGANRAVLARTPSSGDRWPRRSHGHRQPLVIRPSQSASSTSQQVVIAAGLRHRF